MLAPSKTRFAGGRFRAIVVWAMVPLAFWNGSPTFGCICADGHFETNCPMLAARMLEGNDQQSASQGCCGCSCCAGSGLDSSASSVCHTEPQCCEHSESSDDESRVGGKNCCMPVVRAPLLPPVVGTVQFADDHHQPALHTFTLESAGQLVATHVEHVVVSDTGPPPGDLVIRLRRLVI
jgi:hypothetical protein